VGEGKVKAVEAKKADEAKNGGEEPKLTSNISFGKIAIDPRAIMREPVLARTCSTPSPERCFTKCVMPSSDHTSAQAVGRLRRKRIILLRARERQ
jgi:hypothetical protein